MEPNNSTVRGGSKWSSLGAGLRPRDRILDPLTPPPLVGVQKVIKYVHFIDDKFK